MLIINEFSKTVLLNFILLIPFEVQEECLQTVLNIHHPLKLSPDLKH